MLESLINYIKNRNPGNLSSKGTWIAAQLNWNLVAVAKEENSTRISYRSKDTNISVSNNLMRYSSCRTRSDLFNRGHDQ